MVEWKKKRSMHGDKEKWLNETSGGAMMNDRSDMVE